LSSYAKCVIDGLLTCELADGLIDLRAQTSDSNWLIISGGDEKELNDIFRMRNLTQFFNGGIFGSPNDKKTILDREIASGNIRKPALFLGDSRYDYLVARDAGLDFAFLSGWSEFFDFKDFFSDKEIYVFKNIKSMIG